MWEFELKVKMDDFTKNLLDEDIGNLINRLTAFDSEVSYCIKRISDEQDTSRN